MCRVALLLVVVSVLVAGCGGAATPRGGGAPAEIRGVFDAYRSAMVHADFPRACRALAPSEARKAQALVRSFGVGGGETCAGALRDLSDLARAQGEGKAILDTLRRSRVTAVTVTGSRARFRYRTPTSTARAGAEKIAGRWRVTGVTGS